MQKSGCLARGKLPIACTICKAADRLHYLQAGKIKLTVTSGQGNEAVVGIIEPEQFFGEGGLTGQQVRIFMARAMEGCEVFVGEQIFTVLREYVKRHADKAELPYGLVLIRALKETFPCK